MNVPAPACQFSNVTVPENMGTEDKRRARDREKKRRQRAARKQAAAIEFVRTDASLFLHPDRLSQKAGAPKHLLRRMALKELADNALDAATTVTLKTIDDDTYVVEDDGPGIDPAKVATMFSVTRPMMSTKLIRRPTRGMVGNGNRVVAGAAFASGGGLVVESRGYRQELSFDRITGDTIVTSKNARSVTTGTKITIYFGAALPRDQEATLWGDVAIRLAGPAASPMLTHPHWYSESAFAEVQEAAQGKASDLAALFGINLCPPSHQPIEQDQSGNGEGDIAPDNPASAVTLDMLRRLAPKAPRLLPIGRDAFPGVYKIAKGTATVAEASVPAIIEAWGEQGPKTGGGNSVQIIVNRTPAVVSLAIYPGGNAFLDGCGIDWCSIGIVPKGSYRITIAITTPAIALINDGKTPDLSPFAAGIVDVAGSVLRRAHRPKKRGVKINEVAFEIMEEAYLKASAGGTLPANARQIMYAARPYILERTGQAKLNDAYFTQDLLPTFMDEHRDLTKNWDVVYDARGHLIEPHTDRSVPLGTLQVRKYLDRRPSPSSGLYAALGGLHPTAGPGDRFGAVLFIEKEGFEPLLRAAGIAERFDIAIMSTKGMSVVAARALVDRLSEQGVKILVAHDLDLAGIRIFGTLGSDSRRYTFAQQPDIRRLGLTLEQARAMALQSERQDVKGDLGRLVNGLAAYGASPDERDFILAGNRIELNAMPSDVFVRWLEYGLRQHGVEKVVPSLDVLEKRARHIVAIEYMRQQVRDLEREAHDFSTLAELPADLADLVRQQFQMTPSVSWESALAATMEDFDAR